MGLKLYKLDEDTESYKEGHREYIFHCPGCNEGHAYVTNWGAQRKASYTESGFGTPVWSYNGDPTKPTFTPSLLYKYVKEDKNHICHLYVTDGNIQFLGDCTHHLAGKTIPMEDISA